MKVIILTLLLLPFYLVTCSQNLYFDVHPKRSVPVKKKQLSEAKIISDFVPGYPVNWIDHYVSVEISALCNGRFLKASGINDILTAEQKRILNSADLASDIVVDVKHKYKNPVTEAVVNANVHVVTTVTSEERENSRIHIKMTLVPDVEAEFTGGIEKMKAYFKSTIINKVLQTVPEKFQKGVVQFTINERGGIINAKNSQTSGDVKTDKFLLDAIKAMPKWRPAEDSDGNRVQQVFEFDLNAGGC